jgi:uncharacterized RDD family membrane protein YckC
MTGEREVLWVVRAGQGKDADKFDLVIRIPGGKWRTLARFSGKPTAVVSADRRLHVVSGGTTPNTTVFSVSQDDKMILRGMSPGAKWPLRTPPAALCQVPPLGKSNSPGFIAVVPNERDKLSTATTASQPDQKHSTLTILQTIEGQWTQLDEIDDVPGAVRARISAAAAGNWVYILLVGEDKLAQLLAWDTTAKKTVWKKVTLPDKPQQALAVSTIRDRPVLVTIAPADWTPASTTAPSPPEAVGVSIAIHELQAGEIATKPQIIEHQGRPLTVPGDSAPEVCSLGESSESQLVLLWRGKENYRCALVDLNGTVAENREVKELLKEAPAFDIRAIIEQFFWAIPILLLGFILFSRQKNPVGPMILPAEIIPGFLPKRLVALLIDSAIFSILAILAITLVRPDMTADDIYEGLWALIDQQDAPIELLLCTLGSTVLWVIYGSIMEGVFGATLGKVAMRLKVTSADGTKPTMRQAILRNLIRPVELSRPIIIISVFIPLLTQTRQRVGDIVARTVVVEKATRPNPDDSSHASEDPPEEL